MKKVTMGICARNEEACIVNTLNSIANSAKMILGPSEWEIVTCLNGCVDDTLSLVKEWQIKNIEISSHILICQNANLVEAQRKIINFAKNQETGSVIFFDADLIVDQNCVMELLKYGDSEIVKAAYAVSKPLERKGSSFVEKALNQYDLSPTIFTNRKHLHGRAFLIKDWDIPVTDPQLLADDIYLSFYLLEKYGTESIKMVPSAVVYFHQISSYRDFYNAFRRRQIELQKCLTLFPKFKLFPADQINRVFLWKKLIHESPTRVYWWFILFALRSISRLQYYLGGKRRGEIWIPNPTSKHK